MLNSNSTSFSSLLKQSKLMFSSLAYNQRKKIVKDAYGLNVKSLEDYISNFFFDFDQNKSFQINTVYQEIDELEIDFCDEFENLRKKMIFEAEIDTMGEEGREGNKKKKKSLKKKTKKSHYGVFARKINKLFKEKEIFYNSNGDAGRENNSKDKNFKISFKGNDKNEKYGLRQRKSEAKYTENNEQDEITPEEAKIFKKKIDRKLKALMKEAELKEQEQMKPKASFPKTIEAPPPPPLEPASPVTVEQVKFSCFIDDSEELGNEIENKKTSGTNKKEDNIKKKRERRGRNKKEGTKKKISKKKKETKKKNSQRMSVKCVSIIKKNKVETRGRKKKIKEKTDEKKSEAELEGNNENNDVYMNRKQINEETNYIEINGSRPNTRQKSRNNLNGAKTISKTEEVLLIDPESKFYKNNIPERYRTNIQWEFMINDTELKF